MVELFLEKKPTDSNITNFRRRTVAGITDENVNAALEFIASADPRVDAAAWLSENPAKLENQFRARFKSTTWSFRNGHNGFQ